VQVQTFNYDGYNIIYPKPYFQYIKEVFVLDVYRAFLLKENDVVMDLGASTGDFCIIASRKVGKSGKVIAVEPDPWNYNLLKSNIERNRCHNVIPINTAIGVQDNSEREIIAALGKRYLCNTRTIPSLLDELQLFEPVNFIKMDIEGMEDSVIAEAIKIMKKANVISLEFHNTKDKIDGMLLPEGFSFKPITMKYVYKKILNSLFLHFPTFYKVCSDTMVSNRYILSKAINGLDMTKGELLAGSYVKDR
jgi:FkbM family methyltransferase